MGYKKVVILQEDTKWNTSSTNCVNINSENMFKNNMYMMIRVNYI